MRARRSRRSSLQRSLVNLEIPRIISIGPMITLNGVFDIYFFPAEMEALIGARLEITPGEAKIDFFSEQNERIQIVSSSDK